MTNPEQNPGGNKNTGLETRIADKQKQFQEKYVELQASLEETRKLSQKSRDLLVELNYSIQEKKKNLHIKERTTENDEVDSTLTKFYLEKKTEYESTGALLKTNMEKNKKLLDEHQILYRELIDLTEGN